MGKREKKLNKRIVGAIIGSTVAGLLGASLTPKGKTFWERTRDRSKRWTSYAKQGCLQTRNQLKKLKK